MIGMNPIESLRAVTSTRGGCLPCWGAQGADRRQGFDADLLVVDGGPLTDPAVLTRSRPSSVLGSESVDVAQFLPRR